MAHQKGIITLDGTLEGINFYIRKGKPVARKAGGGFTAKAIKTKPSMIRVRETNNEFGHCSRVKKQFRLALLPFLQMHHDPGLHGRMMRMLQEIKQCDTVSERGHRTVLRGLQTAMGRKLFTDFAFTSAGHVSAALNCECVYTPADFNFTLNNFDIRKIKFPTSATHVEIQFGVLAFDFSTLTTALHESQRLLLDQQSTGTHFLFSLQTTPDINVTLFAFCSIRFYQEVSGETYVLKGEGALHVSCLEVSP